jgi:hypothetical protein
MARKPNPISKEEINSIISIIKSDGDVAIHHAVDCKKLSFHVFSVTGEYISATTLKRFFGFTKSDFSPSYDTVKILKQYATHFNKKTKTSSLATFIINFFEPIHFEKINKDNKTFHAACRTIALQLKNDHPLLEQVMEPLAKNENGRRFYFDLFPDYELLSSIQHKGYEKYLLHEKSYEGKMFANCILFLSAYFDNNEKLMKHRWETISNLFDKNKKLHPFVLGRYYQTQLIANFRFNKSNIIKIKKDIFKVETKMPRNETGLFKEFPGFHYFTCDGFWQIKAYEELLQLSTIALHEFKKYEEFTWKGYYGQLYLYRGLALINLDRKNEAKKLLKYIKPEQFYFPTKNYFDSLFEIFTTALK